MKQRTTGMKKMDNIQKKSMIIKMKKKENQLSNRTKKLSILENKEDSNE